jgi:predicted transposase/invertase (TIGR01784 family)
MLSNDNLFISRPHDAYFSSVFKVKVLAQQLIQKFLPGKQLAQLNLDTLQLDSETYISKKMRRRLSDLVYHCETKEKGDPIRICFLFEHKSRPSNRLIYGQIGHYLFDIQEQDVRQNRPVFTLTVPVLFYHGKQSWQVRPLREQYGNVPIAFKGCVPHYDLVVIHLAEMSDEQILAMEDARLLRNVLLTFKHARNARLLRIHLHKILIFADENSSDEVLMHLFDLTFYYIQHVSPIKEKEIMELVKHAPTRQSRRIKTLYEQIMEKGMEKGIEKGMEKGMETLLTVFLRKHEDWSDQQIAANFDLDVEVVTRIRATLSNMN